MIIKPRRSPFRRTYFDVLCERLESFYLVIGFTRIIIFSNLKRSFKIEENKWK